jgi:hypothetical protein
VCCSGARRQRLSTDTLDLVSCARSPRARACADCRSIEDAKDSQSAKGFMIFSASADRKRGSTCEAQSEQIEASVIQRRRHLERQAHGHASSNGGSHKDNGSLSTPHDDPAAMRHAPVTGSDESSFDLQHFRREVLELMNETGRTAADLFRWIECAAATRRLASPV